jgi:D-serine deaminase-like pyridoxal phosphate-dependent protein
VIEARLVETAPTINGRLKSTWTEILEYLSWKPRSAFVRVNRNVTVALEVDVVKLRSGSHNRTLTVAEEAEAANGLVGNRESASYPALANEVACGIGRPTGLMISVLTLALEAELAPRPRPELPLNGNSGARARSGHPVPTRRACE